MIPHGRRAEPGDAAFQQALFVSVRLPEFLAGGLPEPVAWQLVQQQYRIRQAAYATRYPGLQRWLLTFADQPVGELQWASDPEGMHLVDIAVLPEFRRQGFGGAAIVALQSEAARTGQSLRLSVRRDNPARRLYARLGFVDASTTNDALDLDLIWSSR